MLYFSRGTDIEDQQFFQFSKKILKGFCFERLFFFLLISDTFMSILIRATILLDFLGGLLFFFHITLYILVIFAKFSKWQKTLYLFFRFIKKTNFLHYKNVIYTSHKSKFSSFSKTLYILVIIYTSQPLYYQKNIFVKFQKYTWFLC